MLDRTQKRVEHGREREVGDGRRGIIGKGETIDLLGRHATEFPTNCTMVNKKQPITFIYLSAIHLILHCL